jgi:hypothetical protein
MSTPTQGRILKASMFSSPEKPFDLPVYAEAMAQAFVSTSPRSAPRKFHGDHRVLGLLDLDATVDHSIPLDSPHCESGSMCGEIFQGSSSKSSPSSDDGMSESS